MKRNLMKWNLMLILFLCAAAARAQVPVTATVTGTVLDPNGVPYAAGSGRAVLIPTNQSFTVNQTNPVTSPVVISSLDSFGKFSITLVRTDKMDQSSGLWQFQFCANQSVQPTTCFTVPGIAITADPTDISAQIQAAAAPLPITSLAQFLGLNNNWTGLNSYSKQITSTLATGTAPFSIASTTVVPNLNAQLHNGLKGFRVNVGWIHNTGSALVTYNLQLNGVNVAHIVNSGMSGNGAWVNATVLNTGSTTGTVVWYLLDFSLNQVSAGQATTLTGLAWSSSQTLQFTFSVANTDQVTPVFWNVELIQ